MIFPLDAALDGDLSRVDRALGVLSIVAFGALYMHAYHWIGVIPERETEHTCYRHLGLMIALAIAGYLIYGIEAIGLIPFIVVLAIVSLPLPIASVFVCIAVVLPSYFRLFSVTHPKYYWW